MDQTPSTSPQRISIQGISGAGKTTLGRELGRRLGIPHLETDALVHGPDWVETPDAELRRLVEPLLARERWVIDSDYRRKLGTLVLENADTVVWLDLPLRVCLRRLWRRTRRRMRRHEQLWNGNAESWWSAFGGRDSLFVFAIRKHRSQRRTLPRLLARPELAHLRVVRLRSEPEVDSWLLAQVAVAADGPAPRADPCPLATGGDDLSPGSPQYPPYEAINPPPGSGEPSFLTPGHQSGRRRAGCRRVRSASR